MNKLTGTITQIQQSGAIMLIDVDVNGHGFSALLIESANSLNWIYEGNTVNVVFKETEVSLAKDFSGKMSMRNQMNCKILHIGKGELLSKIKLQFKQHTITSVITTRSANALQLSVNDEVDALVKANEVSLMTIERY
jgi:molybdopterin-binding protein